MARPTCSLHSLLGSELCTRRVPIPLLSASAFKGSQGTWVLAHVRAPCLRGGEAARHTPLLWVTLGHSVNSPNSVSSLKRRQHWYLSFGLLPKYVMNVNDFSMMHCIQSLSLSALITINTVNNSASTHLLSIRYTLLIIIMIIKRGERQRDERLLLGAGGQSTGSKPGTGTGAVASRLSTRAPLPGASARDSHLTPNPIVVPSHCCRFPPASHPP